MLGVLRAGCRCVAVDAAFPAERQRLMHAGGGAALTLVEPDLTPPAGAVRPVELTALMASALSDGAAGVAPDRRRPRQAPAYTLFTSGSTGTPLPVTVPVGALAYSTAARLAYYRQPVTAFLLCSSISFDSSVAGIFWTLACGGLLIVPADRPSNVAAVLEAARQHRPGHTLLIPSLYEIVLAGRHGGQLSSLTTVVVAGEACPPHLVGEHFRAFPDVRLFNEYGPTECTVWSTVHECQPADASGPVVPIGVPIPGALAYVRSASGDPVPAGETGELWIGGPGVVPELPGAAGRLANAGGGLAYRTGDQVRLRPDGLLEYRGRLDDQIKIGGMRLELGEIEAALAALDPVRSAAVGVAGRNGGRPSLTAFVVPSGPAADVQALRARLLTRLPAVAVPTAIVAVDSLPVQPNGKVDRRALDRRAEQHREQESGASASP
jgi:amino acid adenylation domain-containing protein